LGGDVDGTVRNCTNSTQDKDYYRTLMNVALNIEVT